MTEYVAKSVILDIADNYTDNYLSLRQVDFWFEGSKIALTSSDYTAYDTSHFGTGKYEALFCFDTTTSKTGIVDYTSWFTIDSNTAQRLIVVFDSEQTFDGIRINNGHASGGDTDQGVQNVKINISTDAITDTTYNAAIANSTEIYDSTFDEHTAVNEEDEQTLVLIAVAVNDLDATIPMATLELNSGSAIDSTIPMATFEMMPPPYIAGTIPIIEIIMEGNSNYGDVVAGIPSLSLSVSADIVVPTLERYEIDMALPSLGLSIDGPSNIAIELPSLFLEADGRTGKVANVKATLPSLTMSAKTGLVATLGLPGLSMEMEVSSGDAAVELTGDILASIPSLGMRATTKTDDAMDMTIPTLTMGMNTAVVSGVADDALRYVRGAVR